MISGSTNDDMRSLQDLSALTDGECEPGQLQVACEAWRRDPDARSAWHAYALIGDVMRSDDLASTADRDEAFLQRLRSRLADEPVVLAPMPLPASLPPATQPAEYLQPVAMRAVGGAAPRRLLRRRWVSPAAVAAGLMMASGAMVVMRDSAGPEGGQRVLAVQSVQGAPKAAPGPLMVTNPQGTDEVIRNAELDRYLAAHRQYSQGAALAMPGVARQLVVNPVER